MGGEVTAAQKIYEQLWDGSFESLKLDGPRIDSLLRNKNGDPRRGVTLVARPGITVQNEAGKFLRELAAVCPGQYFYLPAELHMTVLAIIAGSVSWRSEIYGLPAYQKILDSVLKNRRPFSVIFRGVTLSPDAVMIQGFPTDDSLTRLREELRSAFQQHGFGKILDRRYKIATAHMTVARFATPGEDWRQLLSFLQMNRERDFGETRFQTLQLIWGDWCASAGTARILQEYPLNEI